MIRLKVWFAKTYWRPEDCIEEKDASAFYEKFDPVVTNDIKVFSFFQMLFTIAVSGSVLFFIFSILSSRDRYLWNILNGFVYGHRHATSE